MSWPRKVRADNHVNQSRQALSILKQIAQVQKGFRQAKISPSLTSFDSCHGFLVFEYETMSGDGDGNSQEILKMLFSTPQSSVATVL